MSLLACMSLAAVVAVAAAAPAAATTGLAGEWRFDEGVGRVARDSSGAGLDGELGIAGTNTATPSWIAGALGSALHFDGDDDVRLPDTAALEPQRMTLEARVRRAGTPGQWRYVISKGASACFASSYGLYTGASEGIAFYVAGSSGFVVSRQAPPGAVWDGAWHHVAGTYDGDDVRLYVDGVEIGAAIPGPSAITYGLSSRNAYVGTYIGDCELPFVGDIDSVRVWRLALTAGEIASAAASPATRPQPDPALAGQGAAESRPGCTTLSVDRRRLRAGRRATVTAIVRRRRSRVARATVVLSGPGMRARTRRTNSRGRARFSVRPPQSGWLRLRVTGQRRSCRAAIVRVRVRGAARP